MISRCPMETCKPSRDKYGTILNEKVKGKEGNRKDRDVAAYNM
jgi:hypothetical protein